jgi:tetratricopeptide (TPR) repeat protein
MREVFNRDPDNAEVCYYLSFILTCEGKYEEALSMARKAVSLKEMGLIPNPARAPIALFYLFSGASYHMAGKYEVAITAFKKAINLWPDFVNAHILLAASYTMAGHMEEARAKAAEVLRMNPKITLENVAKNGYFNYKRADKERFINTLRKAGLK